MTAATIWTIADLPGPAVALADMKSHLREDSAEQDAVITAALLAATRAVEKHTQRVLVQRTATLRSAVLPSGRAGLRLPGGRVSGTPSVTIEGASFVAFEVIGDSPAFMVPNAEWPTLTREGYPVSVTYTVGPTTASPDLLAAVKLIAAELYERRSDGSEMSISSVPVSAAMLMQPHRIWAK